MNNPLFYPINSTSLASIFSYACIYPAALYENRNNDIQSNLKWVILLTSNFGCQECDCCLEIVLTEDEKSEYLSNLNNGFFFYEKPIPISRVKKAHFATSAQAKRTTSSIRMSTAFIPEHLIDYNDNKFDNICASIVQMPSDFQPNKSLLQQNKDEFNRILGALALMKVAHTEECNVSPHYIDGLAFFNSKIRVEKSKMSRVVDAFTPFSIFKEQKNSIKNTITEQQIEDAAKKHNQQIKKNSITKIIDINALDGLPYIYAVLYTYGVENESKRKKIDELIFSNFQLLKTGKAETTAFYYGYNRGYSILGNVYRNDKKEINVKFKMDSQLDYYAIESVYNYVVFHKESGDFGYLEWVSPQKHRDAKKGEYIILDTLICDQKKINLFSKEWWSESLPRYLKKEDTTLLGIDFSSSLIERVIKPWTSFVEKDLKEAIEQENRLSFDNLRKHTDEIVVSLKEAKDSINRLNRTIEANSIHIKELEDENKELKEKINLQDIKDLGYSALNEKHITYATNNLESTEEKKDNVSVLSIDEKRSIIEKAIEYSSSNIPHLKKIAVEKGLTISDKTKKNEIILKLLGCAQDTSSLFNNN